MIYMTVMTFGSWDSLPYKKLNISWDLAVRLAKHIAKKKDTQVRLAESKYSCDPYRLSGSYFHSNNC